MTQSLPADAIANPDNPDHYMVVQPVERLVVLMSGQTPVAETREAVRVIEVGRGVYAPVLYLPMEAIRTDVRVTERRSHCPLKGEAVYFDLLNDDGSVMAAEVGWAYPQPLEFAAALAGRIAFYTDQLTVVEAPL